MAAPKSGKTAKKWTNAKKLQKAIDEYFDLCKKGEEVERLTKKGEVVKFTEQIPPLVSGLCYHLGFATRKGIDDYIRRKDKLAPLFTHAKLRIETDNAMGAMLGRYEPKTTALIMATHFGYSTKSDINHGLNSEAVQAILSALPPDYAEKVREALEGIANKGKS